MSDFTNLIPASNDSFLTELFSVNEDYLDFLLYDLLKFDGVRFNNQALHLVLDNIPDSDFPQKEQILRDLFYFMTSGFNSEGIKALNIDKLLWVYNSWFATNRFRKDIFPFFFTGQNGRVLKSWAITTTKDPMRADDAFQNAFLYFWEYGNKNGFMKLNFHLASYLKRTLQTKSFKEIKMDGQSDHMTEEEIDREYGHINYFVEEHRFDDILQIEEFIHWCKKHSSKKTDLINSIIDQLLRPPLLPPPIFPELFIETLKAIIGTIGITPDQLRVLLYFNVHGKSHKEIAQLLETTSNSTAALLSTAIRKFREFTKDKPILAAYLKDIFKITI